MLATENRTRSRIKRILAIALPVVGRQIRTIRVHGAILVALLGLVVSGFSQTTISTGGIQGTVTDQSGALPAAKGTTVSSFATHAGEPGVIYAANNRGLFRSDDAGRSWKALDLPWPKAGLEDGVEALACLPE